MDNNTLNSFKQEIETMFEKSFQELSQKNNLNKVILENLMGAASTQAQKINHLDTQIQSLKKMSTSNLGPIKNQVNSQEKIIHDNFDSMMYRLSQIEQGITHAQSIAENNTKINKESEQSLNQLLRQMEKIQKQEGVPEFRGNRDQLSKEVEEFQKLLNEENQKLRENCEKITISQKTILEPLQSFETKVAVHVKKNEEILKDKLRNFSQKLRDIQKKVQEAHWKMNKQVNQTKNEQNKLIEEMNFAEKQMIKLRQDLQITDQRRKQEIQSSALTLDNMVEEMLAETKKLQMKVDHLRKGFEQETQKFKKH